MPNTTLLMLHPLAGTPSEVVHVETSPFSIGSGDKADWRPAIAGFPDRIGVIVPHALGCRLVGFAAPTKLNGVPVGPEADARHGDLLELWPGWRFVIRLPLHAQSAIPSVADAPRLLLSDDGPSRRELARTRRRRIALLITALVAAAALIAVIQMRRPRPTPPALPRASSADSSTAPAGAPDSSAAPLAPR